MNLVVSKRKIILFLESCFLLAMLVCMRGMILGNLLPLIGLFVGAVILVANIRVKFDYRIVIFAICCLFWGYCVIQGLVLNSNSKGYLVQLFLFWFIEGGAAFFAFQEKEKREYFCSFIIRILKLISIFYCVSLALGILLGWNKITLFKFDYNYFYKAPVLFPFTLVYGSGDIAGREIYRLLGFARESGIMQCMFSWGFFMAEKYTDKTGKNLTKMLMLLGIIGCMSTTGFVIFFSILAINQLTKNIKKLFPFQTIGIILVVILAILFLTGESSFGFKFRWENSFGDRILAMTYGYKNLKQNPLFGIGFFRPSGNATIQAEVNFVAALGNIGIIGGTLFILIYVIALINVKEKRIFLTTNADFFLTAILAQPLYVSPLMYIFMFAGLEER